MSAEPHAPRDPFTEAITAAVLAAVADLPRREVRALTVDQAADWLEVSRDTVYRAIKAGAIPALKVGKEYRISSVALEDALHRTGA